MKSILLPVAAILVAFTGGALAQQSVSELSTVAQRAYLSGDVAKAKENFGLILQIDPKNKVAANYMRMIRTQEERSGQGGALAKQLETLILPKVELKETSFPEALEALKQQAARVSEGKVAVSFVMQTSPEVAKQTVTLNLANVPFTEVLKYVGELTGTKFDIEKFAVVVRPVTQEVVVAPTPDTLGQ